MAPKLFRFTHFPKNTSATSLESHTFKTKDLKPFRFTHLQKKGGGGSYLLGGVKRRKSVPRYQSQVTNHQSPVSPASLTLPANPAIKLALPFVFARLCTLPEESCIRRPTED